jgi:hypothetical protein
VYIDVYNCDFLEQTFITKEKFVKIVFLSTDFIRQCVGHVMSPTKYKLSLA